MERSDSHGTGRGQCLESEAQLLPIQIGLVTCFAGIVGGAMCVVCSRRVWRLAMVLAASMCASIFLEVHTVAEMSLSRVDPA